jgi:transaldolase
MPKTRLHELAELGQSVWLDYISRSMIDSGRLKSLIDQGVLGVTSNPSIFNNAVSKSSDYDARIKKLAQAGKTTFEIYDDLTIQDIQDAADIFRPTWENSNGMDGNISLEINPKLAYDTEQSIEEGLRLHAKVDRPNIMLKVPATDQGFPAVTALISKGISVNITLIFSLQQYTNTVQAYFDGIEKHIENSSNENKVCSVASVFVSRVDTLVDTRLEELIDAEHDEDAINMMEALRGKAAIANAAIIYHNFCDLQKNKRFTALHRRGAKLQRIVWGSTSTKNPDYSDIKYVTELIAKNTVNTIPDGTLKAFLDHGQVKEHLTCDKPPGQRVLSDFDALLDSIEKKAQA